MIHHGWDLFYDIYNTINEYNQKQIHYVSSIPNYFQIISNYFQIISSIPNYIVNWIFHVSDFLRLFMMSFKLGLILLRYSSTDNVLFLSLLLSYSL